MTRLRIVGLLLVLLGQGVGGGRHPPPGFRSCFDRIPYGADPSGVARTLPARYGRFRSARQVSAWSEPSGRHVETARSTLVFQKATLPARVTVRVQVDEAAATEGPSCLGKVRSARIEILDPARGDLAFP